MTRATTLFFAALAVLPVFGCNCDDGVIDLVRRRISATTPIEFGDVLVGLTAARPMEVTNEGDVALNISKLIVADDFRTPDYQFTVPSDSVTLAPRQTIALEVKFRPFAVTGSVAVTTFQLRTDAVDEEGRPVEASVELRGRGVDRALSIEPKPVDFGTVIAGGFEERELTVTNLLSYPVAVLLRNEAIMTRSGNGLFELITPIAPDGSLIGEGRTLDGGATATIRARYTPNTRPNAEVDRGRATIGACADELCDQNADFIGRASLIGISCAPASIDFGAVNPDRRAAREVICKSEATQPLRVRGWALSASSAPEFIAGPPPSTPTELAPGEIFTVPIAFAPTLATLNQGPLNGELAVVTETIDGAPLREIKISLLGATGGPGISVAPENIAFGEVAIGTRITRRIQVSNIGYAPLAISRVSAGDPVFSTDGAPITLAAGQAVIWEITFAPDAAQSAMNILSIESDDAVTPIFEVSLSGTGVALAPCEYSMTPGALNWGLVPRGLTERLEARIENTGAGACLIGEPILTPETSDFHLVNPSPAIVTLAPGASFDLPIDFSPTQEGARAAELSFYISDPANDHPRVALSGTGLPPICGNGRLDGVEVCDDGNPFDGDGCDSNCTLTACGNSIVSNFELCDDGNLIDGDGCDADCTPTGVCGNLNLELGEECDDGNRISFDGCTSFCLLEDCGNNTIDPGEQCDDGNRIAGDGCGVSCRLDVLTGVDVASFGQGAMRGGGSGEIAVSGINGPIRSALLFWNGPTDSANFSANALVRFNGNYLTGTNVGFSDDNCWGYNNSQSYRADVTTFVTGDGTYTLRDFIKTNVDVNGASLIIFYDDGDPTNNYTVGIYDGNDSTESSIFDLRFWDQTLIVDAALGKPAFLELHVSDGQEGDDGAILIDGTELVPFGPSFEGDTVPHADPLVADRFSGGLWDIRRWDLTPALIGGPQLLSLTNTAGTDCLSRVVTLTLIAE